MLKWIGGVILSVTIVMSAYVSPTYAASASVVITHIQAGGTGAALQELIVLYNNSDQEVDISGWCVQNKNMVSFACVSTEAPGTIRVMPPRSFATVGSEAMRSFVGVSHFTVSYVSTNQSSGAIIGSNDIITLIDKSGEEVDSHYWTTTLTGGMLYERYRFESVPLTYLDTDQTTDWSIQTPTFIPDDQTIVQENLVDICPNLDGLQQTIEPPFIMSENGECIEVRPLLPPYITEVLPNADGSDDGQEYIELYNPNDQPIELVNYVLKVGVDLEFGYGFPAGSTIEAQSYKLFTNTDINFSLRNSSSRLAITQADGTITSEVPAYTNPPEGEVWALINGEWEYSLPSPGEFNQRTSTIVSVSSTTSSLQACGPNQYRSAETNRCRNIPIETTPSPCREGQERNPETNRCRNIVVATSPAPCKTGQERNSETNRCRNIQAMTKADYKVLGAQKTSNPDVWYIWATVGGLLALALIYAAWEWRHELIKLWYRLLRFVRFRY